MVFSIFSGSFVGFLVILMVLSSDRLYAMGCYTSIISFGDSYTDTGNLKQIALDSQFPAAILFPPYGETFFHEATGRSSDGRLVIDFLAESLGLPFIPPLMPDNRSEIVVTPLEQGVNFAVGGSTSLNLSVLEELRVLNYMPDTSLAVQLTWFKQVLPSFCSSISELLADCKRLIGSSLILVGEIGVNDYNYGLINSGKHVDELKPLVPLVVDAIVSAIKELVELGARTLIVPGNIPIGCWPIILTLYGSQKSEFDPTTGCLVKVNELVEYHNAELQMKLNQIRELHPHVIIVYADYYNAAMKIYRSPHKYGFTNGALKACCGGGGPFNYNVSAECGDASATVCDQPHTYVSWDGIHMTEAAYKLMFTNLFQGPYTTPQFKSLCPVLTPKLRVGLSPFIGAM